MRNGKIMDDRLEGQALRAVEHGLGKEKRWAYESCECVLGNLSANSLKGRGGDSGEAVPQPRSPQRPRGGGAGRKFCSRTRQPIKLFSIE